MIKCVMLVDMLISFDHNQLSSAFKGKYFGQNPLFFPLPSTEIPLFLPCFLVKKVVKCRSMITVGAKRQIILYFLFSKWVTLNRNGKKTGKNRSNNAKTGRFFRDIFFACSWIFPCFLARWIFSTHPRGGRFWPKYLPLKENVDTSPTLQHSLWNLSGLYHNWNVSNRIFICALSN